ncbi:MAG: hypothetical protein HYT87_06200 [Nitrospirae bacterium]|nr:hypothetical protein [Nitrospirota bacterium]
MAKSINRKGNLIVALLRRRVWLQEESNRLLRRIVSNGRFGGNGARTRRGRKH